jgi:hypothetical protein
MTPLKSPI